MKLEETKEMSYPRKYVEHIFIGLDSGSISGKRSEPGSTNSNACA
jgi:hypothetical protein